MQQDNKKNTEKSIQKLLSEWSINDVLTWLKSLNFTKFKKFNSYLPKLSMF